MLLFIYFNPVIGPDLLSSNPENATEIISDDDLDQIKRLMDAATPGFFTHAFSSELNTVNYFFLIPSEWARGKQEMAMITVVVEEESPNLTAYKMNSRNLYKKMKQERPTFYQALYINNPSLNHETEIKEEFEYFKEQFAELAKFFSIGQIQTHGLLLGLEELKAKESLPMPAKVLRDLETLEKKKNYFVVFQRCKDSFKIDIFPYERERILKIAVIFTGQLGPETLRLIGLVFQEMKLPLIFSSGICQQGGKCIYEVYMDPLEYEDFQATADKLKTIKNVEDVRIMTIESNKADQTK